MEHQVAYLVVGDIEAGKDAGARGADDAEKHRILGHDLPEHGVADREAVPYPVKGRPPVSREAVPQQPVSGEAAFERASTVLDERQGLGYRADF
jgi:hypothetical protein